MDTKADPTNPVLVETIEKLQNEEAEVWNRTAEFLGKVNRDRPEVNISDIQRVAEDGDTVVVPGKLLGTGYINKEVTVAAFNSSRSAREKIESEGEFKFISDLVDDNPDGEGVKIVR